MSFIGFEKDLSFDAWNVFLVWKKKYIVWSCLKCSFSCSKLWETSKKSAMSVFAPFCHAFQGFVCLVHGLDARNMKVGKILDRSSSDGPYMCPLSYAVSPFSFVKTNPWNE